jgi:hypothetical protein
VNYEQLQPVTRGEYFVLLAGPSEEVVPTNNTAKSYRVYTDATGRITSSGNTMANSITALGANQISVGIALNAVGVTYDVRVITEGMAEPD